MIAVIENGKVTLAASGRFYYYGGYLKFGETVEDNVPIFKVENDSGIIVGVEGNQSIIDRIRFDSEFVSGELTYENVVNNVLPRYKKILKEFGKISQNGSTDATLFLAQGDRCFKVLPKFGVLEVSRTAAGSDTGDTFTLSYVEHHPEMPLHDRIEQGRRIGEPLCGSSCYPIVIMDTESKKLTVIDKTENT